jgi:hypothetical protein
MLAAIDANAGGQLVAAGKEPDNALLTKCLVNKPMLLKLQVWEVDATDGSGKKRGNWVSAVAPKQAGTSAPAPAPAPAPAFVDSDVPF